MTGGRVPCVYCFRCRRTYSTTTWSKNATAFKRVQNVWDLSGIFEGMGLDPLSEGLAESYLADFLVLAESSKRKANRAWRELQAFLRPLRTN